MSKRIEAALQHIASAQDSSDVELRNFAELVVNTSLYQPEAIEAMREVLIATLDFYEKLSGKEFTANPAKWVSSGYWITRQKLKIIDAYKTNPTE
jgi:hypothetical protein